MDYSETEKIPETAPETQTTESEKRSILRRVKAAVSKGAGRALQFIDDHPLLIKSAALVLTAAVLAKQEHDKIVLSEEVRERDEAIERLQETNDAYLDRMEEKDRMHLRAISDGMRHGSGVCAEDMAEWRRYKRTRDDL